MSRGYVRIRGIDDVRRTLAEIMPREAKMLTRQVTKDVAQAIANEAKPLMPTDTTAMVRGTRAQQERDKDGVGSATVRVRGAFYWKFLERGDGPDGIEHAFFLRAREKVMSQIDQLVVYSFVQRLAARLKRGL
jgi:HK97 gp10 family phage protein